MSQLTPLGVNTLSALLQNTGLTINSKSAGYMGTSSSVSACSPGTIVTSTCLDKLSSTIRYAYGDGVTSLYATNPATYANLISIGGTSIPALGNAKPSAYTLSYTSELTSYGYARLIALQANEEFTYNGSTTVYKDFLMSFMTAAGFIDQSNSIIFTMHNALTFLDGTYSNMNDLISADITGVSLSTTTFGQDLITSGKAIDLTTIATFGLPSNLLATLNRYNSITPSLSLALLSSNMSSTEISDLIAGATPTILQQRNIYGAFMIIVGQDLADILITLNCKTQGLQSLADLLDTKALFPNSFTTLTVPVYNTTVQDTNSKTYYPIYQGTGPSSRLNAATIAELSDYLINILPTSVAITSGAFSATMKQIRNISNVPIEKFAQVVSNLETTMGLAVNGTSVPVSTSLVTGGLALIAFGSGPHNSYTMSDFFGSMSGVPFKLADIQKLIIDCQTANLFNIYNTLYTEVTAPIPNITNIQTQINLANAEIAAIKLSRPTQSAELNILWNNTAKQLIAEKQSRSAALPDVSTPVPNLSQFPTTQYSFIDSVNRYAKSTEPNMYAQTLEAIADQSTIGGQSLIAMMREARNKARLAQAGIPLDSTIPDTLPPEEVIVLLASSPGSAGVYNPITNTYTIDNQPIDTGKVSEPGSFAGSPYQELIPPELNVLYTSGVLLPAVPTVQAAIDEVFNCNCDCWDIV